MGTETFSDFLQLLDRNGELVRVKARVSPVLEIAEIADRMSKSPAPHGNDELDRKVADLERTISVAAGSKWLRLGRLLGRGPKLN